MKKILIIISIVLLTFFLRIYQIDIHPPGFYSDEALTGYEAYSILKTGKDQYGNFLPINFKAFGDFRPGLFIYATVPFVWVFGLTEFAVRLPSVVFSTLTGVVIFFLSYFFWKNYKTAALASLFFTISPWSLQFARMSHDTNLATFLVVTGIYLFLTGLANKKWLVITFGIFGLAFYAYYTPRVFLPFFICFLLYTCRKELGKVWQHAVYGILILGIIILPVVMSFTNREVSRSRVEAVSLWGDPGIALTVNEQRGEDIASDAPLRKLYHNKLINGGLFFLRSFTSHIDPNFLLYQGDAVKIYHTPDIGILLIVEPLLLISLYTICKNQFRYRYLLIGWMILGVLPDTLTRLSPAAPRIHLILPAISLLVGYGMYQLYLWQKQKFDIKKTLVFLSVSAVALFQVSYFFHQYFVHTPMRYAEEWHYGLKELVEYPSTQESSYDQILVSRSAWGWINFLFYLKYPPTEVQRQIVLSEKNEFGLGWVYDIGKYHFEDFSYPIHSEKSLLYVGKPNEFPQNTKPQYTIYYPDGKAAFYVVGDTK